MIKTFSLVTLVAFSLSATAQQTAIEPIPTNEKKIAFKVYNLTTIRPSIVTGNNSFRHIYKENDYFQPAVAVRLETARKNFHEIELSEFSIRKRDERSIQYLDPQGFSAIRSGTVLNTISLAARYEYTHPFFKKQNAVLVPALGFAGGLFYERLKSIPYTTNVFPITETSAGMRGFIVPRLNWYVGKRLFFDLNVPICVLQASYRHSDLKNPTMPVAQQSMGVMQFDLLPNYYSFRIGAGWKI